MKLLKYAEAFDCWSDILCKYYIFHFSLQQILNHCIDDIENLVLRTKKSAEAWKKLNKKKGKSKRKFSK